MNKKRGFALVESIFMIVFLSVALLLVYKAFATSFQDERRRVNYDNTDTIYKTYFLKQYFEENGLLTYLPTATFTNGFLELDCSTISSVNKEYCDFLIESNNLDVKKIYITKYDMSNVTYNNLEATTIDYMRTLSGIDTGSYRMIVWFNNNEYASLKIGEPFFTLNIILDGGTWSGEPSQRMNSGDSVNISDPVKEGYIFAGWTVTGAGSDLTNNVFTMGNGDTILSANWATPNYTYAYTGGYQSFTAQYDGYYKIELWGAQGGVYSLATKGKGGYTSGIIYLQKNESIYLYIGGAGEMASGSAIGGYNGGGYSGASTYYTTGGGGATDVRLELGDWNNSTSLNSRIMVAGGGAGADGGYTGYVITGGDGGGLVGASGTTTSSTYNTSTYIATGGTQIAAGFSSKGTGGFGYAIQSNTSGYGTGGGSGYYGGGNGFGNGGAGGSSFLSGYAGVNAITSAASTTPTGNTIHYSNKYFINGSMNSGVQEGNGKAAITYISYFKPEKTNTNLNNVRYIKDCINGSSANTTNHWVELQAIYNGVNVAKNQTVTGTAAQNASYPYTRIVDGDITSSNYASTATTGLQCITVDLAQVYNLDEVAIWHYWVDGRSYNSNVTYVSSDNTNWISVISTSAAETSIGKRVNAWN